MSFIKMQFVLLAILCFLLVKNADAQSSSVQKTIICLTYDDGLESHLATVVPQLDSMNLKATFFLNAIKGSADVIGQASPALTGWKKAAANGHELGNHTMFHPCPQKLGWQADVSIESYSLPQLIQEVRTTDAMLDMIDYRTAARSFAYPCNNTLLQGKNYSQPVLQTGLVQYGRGGGDSNSIVKEFRLLNKMQVPSWLVEEGTTLTQLIAFAEKAKAASGMAVYQFHGIGGQFFKVSKEVHQQFLSYLKQYEQDYQVTTFSDAMKLVVSR